MQGLFEHRAHKHTENIWIKLTQLAFQHVHLSPELFHFLPAQFRGEPEATHSEYYIPLSSENIPH